MTHAYRQYYLEDAMGVLGAAVEAAVMLFEVPLERFWPIFLASDQARRFAVGDPFVVAGQSGWGLAERGGSRGFARVREGLTPMVGFEWWGCPTKIADGWACGCAAMGVEGSLCRVCV